MKRSEMIQRMVENWFGLFPDEFPENNNVSEDIYNLTWNNMDKLLSTVEYYGMSPPGYMQPIPFELDGKQYPLIPGDFQNEKGIWCTPGVQEWEPEDEST